MISASQQLAFCSQPAYMIHVSDQVVAAKLVVVCNQSATQLDKSQKESERESYTRKRVAKPGELGSLMLV